MLSGHVWEKRDTKSFFFETGSRSVTQAGVQWRIMAHCSLKLPGPSDPPASASEYIHATTQADFIFIF